MSLYCHSCYSELTGTRIPPACVACGAIFGRNPDWCPISRPLRRQPVLVHEAASAAVLPEPGETADMAPLPAMGNRPDANESGNMSGWLIFFKIMVAVLLAAFGMLLLAVDAKMDGGRHAIGLGGIVVLLLAAIAAMSKNRWILGILSVVGVLLLGLLYLVALFFAAAAGK